MMLKTYNKIKRFARQIPLIPLCQRGTEGDFLVRLYALRVSTRYLIGIAVFLVSFAALFLTLEDPGITLDEPYASRLPAISYVKWIGLAFEDVVHGEWEHLTSKKFIKEYFRPEYTFHPPFARILTGITWSVFHDSLGEIKALRLAPAILFSLSVLALYLLVSEYYGRVPGLLAALGLLLCPAPFGHAHLIALDSPIASMWTITAFCFVKGLYSRRWAVMFAVAAGLSMNTKIHGFAIPFPLFLWGFFFFRKKALANLWSFLILTPLTVFLTYPKYWYSPESLIYFLDYMASKKNYEQVGTHFLGELHGFSPPKYYAFFMILIAVPPFTLICSLSGLVLSASREIRRFLSKQPSPFLGTFFALNAVTALGLTLFENIPIYDSVRLFLPAFPFLAGLAGIGLYHLSQFLAGEKSREIMAGGFAATVLLFSAISLAKIHPFELSYFNIFVGGLKGATRIGLESTYWNDTFTIDTARMMNDKYSDSVFSEVTGLKYTFRYYKEIGILDESIAQHATDYDYYLLQYRQGWFRGTDWFYSNYMVPEYSVQREGVPLLEIYKSLRAHLAERPDLYAQAGQKISPEGFEWQRYLIVPETGKYDLMIASSLNHRLWIDKRAIQDVSRRYRSYWTYRLQLEKGVHTLDLLFPAMQTAPEFFAVWRTPGGERGMIPRENLLPAASGIR